MRRAIGGLRGNGVVVKRNVPYLGTAAALGFVEGKGGAGVVRQIGGRGAAALASLAVGGSFVVQNFTRYGVKTDGTALGLGARVVRIVGELVVVVETVGGVVIGSGGVGGGAANLRPVGACVALVPCLSDRATLLGLGRGSLVGSCLAALFVEHDYGIPQLAEHVGRSHAHKPHNDERQGDYRQYNGAGYAQGNVEQEAEKSADDTAALEDSTGLIQDKRAVLVGHRGISTANKHVDEGREHHHQQDGQGDLKYQRALPTEFPPKDGKADQDKGDHVSRPADKAEEEIADVVADIAHQMLVGPRVAADDIQHEAGQKEKTDGIEDVGQKLLGKDVVSVPSAVGSSVVHRHLLGVRLVGA